MKRHDQKRMAVGFLIALSLAAGCGPAEESHPSDARLPVFAGIPPLEFIVEQIGGDRVKVESLMRPGQDPHTFEPTPRQVVALGRAAVFFKIDMPFENVLLEKIQAGKTRLAVVDATRGIVKRPIGDDCCGSVAGKGDSPIFADTKIGTVPNSADADHHAEHAHADGFDPHVWLSPPLLKTMARNVAEGLCRADPEHAEEYRINLAALLERIQKLHDRVEKKLKPFRGRSFFVFHPGFGYFADAYGLKEQAVEVAGRAPAIKQLRALVELAKAEGVDTVFVQPEFESESVRVVAQAIGGRTVPLNGLARDVLADIEDIAEKIEESLREKHLEL